MSTPTAYPADDEPWSGTLSRREWISGPLKGVKQRRFRPSNTRRPTRPCSKCGDLIAEGELYWRGIPTLTRCCNPCGVAVTTAILTFHAAGRQ